MGDEENIMIESIKKNIEAEIRMLREVSFYSDRVESVNPAERQLLQNAIESLIKNIKTVNDSIPGLLSEVTIDASKDQSRLQKGNIHNVSFNSIEPRFRISIPSKMKVKLLRELSISEKYIKKIKKHESENKEEYNEFKAARGYLKTANNFFWNMAVKTIRKDRFKKLAKDLQKSNIDILLQSYIAMIYMTVFLSLVLSLFFSLFLLFFDIGLSSPFITFFDGNYIVRFSQIFWVPIVIPLLVFLLLYYYPASEKKSLAKRINQELSFAVIHMSAISGSGIQPSEIFRIIGLSKEYPYLRKEIRKVLNQINLYGYDLVTALNNAAATTSSTKLSELFSGLSTTITSGGDLREFFDKRAETLLNDYRLERQKYAKTAETFMDIYISVVIAAPMILMLLLIMLTLGNFDIGLTTSQLTFLIISIIGFINLIFLVFVHLNQPGY